MAPEDRPAPPDRPPGRSPPRPLTRPAPVILALIAASVAVELTLVAADHGLIGTPRWRGLAYQNGAFWAGLLRDWRPNYAAQPWVMFLSYAFLHSGLWHLAGNMLTLLVLGAIVEERAGQAGMLAIYLAAAVGGGAAFGLLSTSPQPMVGASGALFGLAGAWKYWDFADRRADGRRLWPVWRDVAGLALLNLGLWVMLEGVLAWQTHLGGFVAGWAAAAALAHWRG